MKLLSTGTQTAVSYTGHIADSESGLLYAKARHINPRIGRFLQADPWSGDELRPITLNPYVYANGSPLGFFDPLGLYGVFFDGTNNNVNDPNFGLPTNVAKLAKLYQDGQPEYYGGVGTRKSDGMFGAALGKGVNQRIEEAYADLVNYFNSDEARDMRVNDPERWAREGQIDVYGFSRGATSARLFANLVKTRGIPDHSRPSYRTVTRNAYWGAVTSREFAGYEKFENVNIRQLGIFDTVDARGFPLTSPGRHQLRIDPSFVRNTTHIVAANEYRSAFDLISALPSAGATVPNISETFLPASHSGVGGSHAEYELQAVAPGLYPVSWEGILASIRRAGIDKYALQLMVEASRGAGVTMNSPRPEDSNVLNPIAMSDAELAPYIHDSRTYPETGLFDWIANRTA